MKKNGLAALNLFMRFVGSIGVTYEVLFFDYFNGAYINLETFRSVGKPMRDFGKITFGCSESSDEAVYFPEREDIAHFRFIRRLD